VVQTTDGKLADRGERYKEPAALAA
jgi:hypothetical protein